MPPMEKGKLIAKSPLVWALFLRQTADSNSFVIIINKLICFVLIKFLPSQMWFASFKSKIKNGKLKTYVSAHKVIWK